MKPISLTLLALITIPPVVLGASPPAVEVVDTFSQPRSWDGHVSIPYFDAQDHLRWNDEAVSAAGSCSADWFPGAFLSSPRCGRRTVMLNPRVDECRCSGKTKTHTGTAVAYAGIDKQSHETWRRQSLAPTLVQGPLISGATPEGLVFSDFEVWSPLTGKTLRAATRTPGSFSSACYLPERNAFLKFDADVTLLKTHGGVYLYAPDGKQQLVLPVERSLLGYYLIESMAPVPGTSLVLLGESYATRGQGSARFELFDLNTRKILFTAERAKGHYITDVRVAAGKDGNVAFSFLDESAGKYQAVHYRIH